MKVQIIVEEMDLSMKLEGHQIKIKFVSNCQVKAKTVSTIYYENHMEFNQMVQFNMLHPSQFICMQVYSHYKKNISFVGQCLLKLEKAQSKVQSLDKCVDKQNRFSYSMMIDKIIQKNESKAKYTIKRQNRNLQIQITKNNKRNIKEDSKSSTHSTEKQKSFKKYIPKIIVHSKQSFKTLNPRKISPKPHSLKIQQKKYSSTEIKAIKELQHYDQQIKRLKQQLAMQRCINYNLNKTQNKVTPLDTSQQFQKGLKRVETGQSQYSETVNRNEAGNQHNSIKINQQNKISLNQSYVINQNRDTMTFGKKDSFLKCIQLLQEIYSPQPIIKKLFYLKHQLQKLKNPSTQQFTPSFNDPFSRIVQLEEQFQKQKKQRVIMQKLIEKISKKQDGQFIWEEEKQKYQKKLVEAMQELDEGYKNASEAIAYLKHKQLQEQIKKNKELELQIRMLKNQITFFKLNNN